MAVFDLRLKKLEHEIEHAGNYDEYEAACLAHDALSGAEEWKAEDASDDLLNSSVSKFIFPQ